MVVASLAFVVGSGLLAAALPAQLPFVIESVPCNRSDAITPQEIYYGKDRVSNPDLPTRLRISNGGAGLSGLVGHMANAFIVSSAAKSMKIDDFKIEWIKGDTTETLQYLGTGQADVGITYNKAAECQALADNVANDRVYGFRDHFYLVGPPDTGDAKNPANLTKFVEGGKNEDVLQQFQKIVRTGNKPPKTGLTTRFLSRYDKSATNIKDSELFVRIGQVPWGIAYSKWYHQYTMYPIDALTAAALLKEYTITDRGTWLSTPKNVTDLLARYNEGADADPADPLLNPAFFLSSSHSCDDNAAVAKKFLEWTIGKEGQETIKGYKGNGTEWLYTGAPDKKSNISDCGAPGL